MLLPLSISYFLVVINVESVSVDRMYSLVMTFEIDFVQKRLGDAEADLEREGDHQGPDGRLCGIVWIEVEVHSFPGATPVEYHQLVYDAYRQDAVE